MMTADRCWYMKFFPEKQCAAIGEYGSPTFIAASGRGQEAAQKFCRAARWCADHRHPDDILIKPRQEDEG